MERSFTCEETEVNHITLTSRKQKTCLVLVRFLTLYTYPLIKFPSESEPFYPSAPPTSSLQQSSTAPSSYSDPSSYGAPSSHGPRSYAAPSDYGAASAYGSAESEVYTNEESGVPLLGATSYSDHRSPPPSQESSNIGGQARTGKAAYIQQLHTQNPTEMVQHADSGIRFGDEGGPSSAPTEVPPSYSAT